MEAGKEIRREGTAVTPPLAELPPDYHLHTERCGHARGSARDLVEAARRRGLPGVGVSDHLPLVHTEHPDPSLAMARDELPDYVAEVLDLKARYPGFVLLGVEADFVPGSVAATRDLLAGHPLDYVIGSVHYLDGWGFDDPRYAGEFARRDVDEVYRRYLDLLGDAAESGLFDILGHLDLVKKFGHRPAGDLSGAWRRLAERLAAAGVAVELNTSGLHKPVGEMYPAPAVLEILAEHGVPITFGSDAHRPEDVGRDFDRALAAARAAGYRAYLSLDPGADNQGQGGEEPSEGATAPLARPPGRARRRLRRLPSPGR